MACGKEGVVRPTKGRIRATFEDGSICSAWIDEEFVPGEVLHILVMNGHYRGGAFLPQRNVKAKGVRRKIVLSAAEYVFSCMISIFHTMKLTRQIMMCTFHCTKSCMEWGVRGLEFVAG
jgi:hypothetical protein